MRIQGELTGIYKARRRRQLSYGKICAKRFRWAAQPLSLGFFDRDSQRHRESRKTKTEAGSQPWTGLKACWSGDILELI